MSENDISRQLKLLRLQRGLSLSQLAQRVDTTPSTLSRYENGWQRFEIYTLRKLATALGCRLKVELEPMDSTMMFQKSSSFRNLQRLFWDRKLRKHDLKDYPLWVLQRVLEYGEIPDVRFLVDKMGRGEFLKNVARIRFTSARTENFWKLILQREGILCTEKFSREEVKTCWPG